MSLANFNIIVATDAGNGIAKNSTLPWRSQSDGKFFNTTTSGRGKNAVIMGRLTYESIPPEHRPLKHRHCVVISRTWKQEQHQHITVCESLLEALATLGAMKHDEVFIAGGEQIYQEAVRDFLYLCKRIYVTKYKIDYSCDQFFPWDQVKDLPEGQTPTKTRDYIRYTIAPNIHHPELNYISELERISERGETKPSLTGIVISSVFGSLLRFNLSNRLPVMTGRKLDISSIIKELLFCLTGNTDNKILNEQGVHKWDIHTSESALIEKNLDYDEGELGPYMGEQWRKWTNNDEENHIDQISNLVNNLKTKPHDVHVLTGWNVSVLDKMAILPSLTFQFYVSGDRKYIDCSVTSVISDYLREVPEQIVFSALLTYMLGHVSALKPRHLTFMCNQAYVTTEDKINIKKLCGRYPRPFPKLSFRRARRLLSLEDFTFDSFIIEDYTSWENITLN